MTDLLSFGLDLIILAALGVTIFFAVRLSISLKRLRLGQEEFHLFMEELAQNIKAAEEAIHNLKQASLATGEQLRRKVREGQHLHDELEIMVETASNIADRLDQSAEKAGTAQKAQKKSRKAKKSKNIEPEAQSPDEKVKDWIMEDVEDPSKEGTSLPSFFIQDKEFKDTPKVKTGEDTIKSQAERDLYEALQSKKNKKTG